MDCVYGRSSMVLYSVYGRKLVGLRGNFCWKKLCDIYFLFAVELGVLWYAF